MTNDPIVEEIHRIREEYAQYAASFNYDLDAIVADPRAKQEKSNWKVVRLEPKRVDNDKTA